MRMLTRTRWKDDNGARQYVSDSHALIAFGRLAEICERCCRSGRRVFIQGRMRTREIEGRDDVRRTVTEVVVHSMLLLDPIEDKEADMGGPSSRPAEPEAGVPGGSAEPVVEREAALLTS
jgi:single-strand DNA-binding protein